MACHRSDDVHDGQFGVRCEQCHVTESWKKFQRRLSQASKPEEGRVSPEGPASGLPRQRGLRAGWTNEIGIFL
jgi:hypothetical protein